MTLPNISRKPCVIFLCKWQDDIVSFKCIQFIVKMHFRSFLNESKKVENTVKKLTFIFGFVWESIIYIYLFILNIGNMNILPIFRDRRMKNVALRHANFYNGDYQKCILLIYSLYSCLYLHNYSCIYIYPNTYIFMYCL